MRRGADWGTGLGAEAANRSGRADGCVDRRVVLPWVAGLREHGGGEAAAAGVLDHSGLVADTPTGLLLFAATTTGAGNAAAGR
jgi:hypothetical protein